MPRNGWTQQLDRTAIDTLSAGLSSAAAPLRGTCNRKTSRTIAKSRFIAIFDLGVLISECRMNDRLEYVDSLDSQSSLLKIVTQSKIGHLMTRSARTSTFGGIVRPICLAAFRLMTNSNFMGCSTGRSAGLAPLRILST